MLVLVLTACAREAPRTALHEEGRRSRASTALERRLKNFEAATGSLKALAWLRIDSPERTINSDAAVVVERPDRIRVDVIDSLADVWASAGSDGQTMWLYVPGKRKLYEGRATEAGISRLASFGLSPSHLISLLAGTPPVAADEGIEEAGSGRDRHFIFASGGLRCWLENGERGRVSRCEKPSDGGVDYEISFSDYRRAGAVEFPHSIEARFPSRDSSLSIRYREVETGGRIDPASFDPPRARAARTHRYRR